MKRPTPSDSVLEAARGLRSVGVVPIPVRHRDKKPRHVKWTRYEATDENLQRDFGNGPTNIGALLGEPSGGLVDVDLDVPEAVALAPRFLPSTGWKTGRTTPNPSHWFYRSPGVSTQRWKDPAGGVLLEVRSTGAHTVMPPSVHPTGERYEWIGDGGELALVERKELDGSLGRLAAAALLAKHYPAEGSRHDATLALVGMLLRAGWKCDEVSTFVESLARVAGDEESHERLRNIKSTSDRLKAGSPATGGPTLARLIGERVARRAAEWLGISWTEQEAVGRLVSEIEPEAISWLWKDRIPLAKLTILDGDPGLGKSTVALDLAARITSGRPMPDGSPGVEPAGVVLLSAEDGAADTIRPRLEAAGANIQLVRVVEAVSDGDGTQRLVDLQKDEARVEQAMLCMDARLLIVDPILAYLGDKADAHKEQEVRRVLGRLKLLAERTGATVLAIRHLNKNTGLDAIYRGTGSIAFAAAARSVLLVAKDRSDPSARVLLVTKKNLAPDAKPLVYRVVSAAVDDLDTARIQWEGPCEADADDLLAPRVPGSATRREQAREWLEHLLKDGPKMSREIEEASEGAGFSKATLRRAREGLVNRDRLVEGTKRTYWMLPGQVSAFDSGPEVECGGE